MRVQSALEMTLEQSGGCVNRLSWVLPITVACTAIAACSSDEPSSKADSTTSAAAGAAGAASDNPKSGGLISSPDVCQTALACENFDALPLEGAPIGTAWTATQNLGTVRVDATHAYSGTQSVKATTPDTTVAYKAALLGYRDPSVLPT